MILMPTPGMEKICMRCGLPKDIEQFNRIWKGKDKRQSRCKACMVEVQKDIRHANPKAGVGSQQVRNERLRRKLRDIIAAAKSRPCMDCGNNYPCHVMDFDHRNGEGKVDNISKLVTRGASRLLAEEIKKCDVVCANCHRIRTHNRGQYRQA